MKRYFLFFYLYLSLTGCGLYEDSYNSMSAQARAIIDRANSEGGSKGVQTLNDEIRGLEDKIAKKEKEYSRLKDQIYDKEDDLDEKEDELDEVENRIREIQASLRNARGGGGNLNTRRDCRFAS